MTAKPEGVTPGQWQHGSSLGEKNQNSKKLKQKKTRYYNPKT
jgi:hypothetical protein